MSIKSPYNFVPAPTEEQVYKPYWADQVSHDVPFEDGQSGEISFTIEAKTPIFVRNGQAKTQPDEEFSHIGEGKDKQYFIPATSIKGMVRNVLEIMSFSRMKQVDGTPFFGLRDMNNREYKNETNQSELKSGWLTKNTDGSWQMEEVAHVRVSMQDIEQKYMIQSRDIQKAETALQKYEVINGSSLQVKTTFVRDLIKRIEGKNDLNYGKLHRFSNDGTFNGTLVFYGNIDNKHYDFVFANESKTQYQVDSSLIEKMNKLNDSLWNYHKPSNRIPVFFRTENNKVKHFGFSKLYRLNSGNSIQELEPVKSYNQNKKDLTQLIFGYTDDEKNSLKGRVFISHAECINPPNEDDIHEEERVLSSPKPSYYPNYLQQSGNDGVLNNKESYYTYVNSNAKLAGFKRYPVHNNPKLNGTYENENIPSTFKPLPIKTSFEFKIRFHNLRRIELGALLSAITFHNTPNLFHSLGGAKPYGFGKVSISIKSISVEHSNTIADFEEAINAHVMAKKIENGQNWLKTSQIIELFSMAKETNYFNDLNLNYPQLEKPNVQAKDANEFNNFKKERKYLQKYSELNEVGEISRFKRKAIKTSSINLDGLETFSDIQNKMRDEYNDEVSGEEVEVIKEKIKYIYQNHKDSRKKLSKPFEDYFAKTPVIKWLGKDEAQRLHSELTNPL